MSAHVAQQENAPAGCSKRPSSKAATSEGPEAYPLGYVEGLNDARTKLADFFSSLLELRNRIDHQLKPGRDGFLPVPLFVLTVPHSKRHGLHPTWNQLGFVLWLFTHQGSAHDDRPH